MPDPHLRRVGVVIDEAHYSKSAKSKVGSSPLPMGGGEGWRALGRGWRHWPPCGQRDSAAVASSEESSSSDMACPEF
jgi:hypothetical protein